MIRYEKVVVQIPLCPSSVKALLAVTLQAVSVTTTFPVVTPTGTVATNVVAFTKLTVAAIPLNVTVELPVNPVPVMVTSVPVEPEVGAMLVTECGQTTVDVPSKIKLSNPARSLPPF